MIYVERINHIVLTVASVRRACHFYKEKLGMEVITFDNNLKALKFGSNKINLHQLGNELEPKARNIHPGSANISFVTKIPIDTVRKELIQKHVLIISDVVEKVDTNGKMKSIYFHDPDGNLLEILNYIDENQ